MKLTADNKKRMVVPDARPGDVFDYQRLGNGHFSLVRLERPTPPRVKLVRRHGYLVAVGSRTITCEETRKAMDEFP